MKVAIQTLKNKTTENLPVFYGKKAIGIYTDDNGILKERYYSIDPRDIIPYDLQNKDDLLAFKDKLIWFLTHTGKLETYVYIKIVWLLRNGIIKREIPEKEFINIYNRNMKYIRDSINSAAIKDTLEKLR